LTPRRVLAAALSLVLSGLLALSLADRSGPLLGSLALAWYNGIYTPLKRRSAFAAVIGAVVGAVPVAIGWNAAGARLADPRFFALAMLFLLWQVPHFWLVLLHRDADYRTAGLPVLTDRFGRVRLQRITLLWTLAAAAALLLLPLFGIVRSPFVLWSLLPVAGLTSAAAFRTLLASATREGFTWLNLFLAVAMVLLSLDPLLCGRG
jgi:protoheme IX farnesyltransferase